ncbi:MAG: class I SAM-dependent methyltransferase [Deltaproteobacteria bacterium]|nr:class I SAM-dependent methyltransferase [Deltaproteobacteria bacterium]MBW1814524.1 class I SAM-dependent methyltransferase [Deltaproteobacteria bacterium]MBW2180892.1 class I SAM-dependent methyltransferase [Deltaproteobacteria bacterium]
MNIEEAKKILGREFGFTVDFANMILQDLKLSKDAKILDIGTGIGNLAIMLALNGYKVVTGEPEEDDSTYAKQDWLVNAKKVNVSHLIEFKHFDAKDTPFEGNTFDAIFFLGSLHHIEKEDHEKVLKECTRISKSNGVICIFEPNAKGIKLIKNFNASHPDAADPSEYAKDFNLSLRKIEGDFFDAFTFGGKWNK